MAPIRILQVVTKMDRAGLETMLMNYYRRIDRERIQFDFLTHRFEKGHFDDEILSMGGKIYRTYPIHPRYFFKYTRDLAAFFQEHPEYKIIHSHIDSLSTFVLRAAQKAGVPIRIAHSHNNSFDKDAKLPLRLLSRKLLPATASHYFGCSKEAVRFMFGDQVYHSGNYTVIYNAIDSVQFCFDPKIRQCMRESLGIAEKLVIGHVGRFVYQKNHEFLIDIFSEVYKRASNAVLLLVGTGENEQKIRDKVAALGLTEAVQFLGVRADISDLMQAMDVFLLPSRFEGLPVVGIEAQASGLKCVLSDVVTKEVDISGNVSFVSLAALPTAWVDKVLAYDNDDERENMSATIANKGYAIQRRAKELETLYLNLYI